MKWKYFWVALAFFVGSYRIKSYTNFAGIAILPILRNIANFIIIVSGLIMAYILSEKGGLIDSPPNNKG